MEVVESKKKKKNSGRLGLTRAEVFGASVDEIHESGAAVEFG